MSTLEQIKLRQDLKKGLRNAKRSIFKSIQDNPNMSKKDIERKLQSAIKRNLKNVGLKANMRSVPRPLGWYRNNCTNEIEWSEGAREMTGYEYLGYNYTEIDAYNNQSFYNGDTQSLSYNGNFVRQYLNEVVVTYDSRNWFQKNLVLKLHAKSTLGAQIGVNTFFGGIQGGLVTIDVGTAEVDFINQSADANWGNGDLHNYFGLGLGLGKGKKKIGIGGEVDYLVKNNYGNYNLENGEVDWNYTLGKSFGPSVKHGYKNLEIKPEVKLKSTEDDCYCFDIGVGAKVIFGMDVDLKVGINK